MLRNDSFPLTGEAFHFYLKSKNKSTILKTSGRSMSRVIKNGWKIKIIPVSTQDTICGDIVVFIQGGIICHRILGKIKIGKKVYMLQRGDSSLYGSHLEKKDLVGKVVEVFDEHGNVVEKKFWAKFNVPLTLIKVLSYGYFFLLFTKRLVFGRKSSFFSRYVKSFFWSFYRLVT